MTDLLPKIIPTDELKTAPEYVTTNQGEIKHAIHEIQEGQTETVDAFEGDQEIIKQEIQEDLDKEQLPQEGEVEVLPPKEIQPDEEVFKGVEKKKKPKRKITEAQREHLAKARLKAAEVRKRKAQERKLVKQQEARRKKKEEKELKNLNAVHNPMESESDEEPEPKPRPRKVVPASLEDIDEDLLVQLQEKAIEKYEVKRKARKEVKKKAQAEEKKEEAVYQAVKKAVQPDPDDMWAVCFQ
jgi:hypothetical protein|tara:strand:- start:5566 stop:6288 length:723 start_codon:yes stop_codon:yes gene_type:complete